MKRLALPVLALSLLACPVEAAAPPFETKAPIAFLKDVNTGAVLYAKNENQHMPPASMAKMMTVYVAFSLIKSGELKLDQKFTVRPETWKQWHGPQAGSTMFLSPGEEVSVQNLLHGIITLSGNDACVVLAEGIRGTEPAFAALMNETARKIGVEDSHFGTSNGWPDEGITYVTAKDLATIAIRTVQDFPDLYKKFYDDRSFTWGQTMGGEAITQANRNPILGRVEGADGLKTGHTQEAGYGMTGSAEQNGRRLVEVIAGLQKNSERTTEAVRLIDWGFRAWQDKPLFKKGTQVSTAEVQMGDSTQIGLVAPRDLAVTLPSGMGRDVKVSVSYKGPIKAPIKKGEKIADLVVTTPETGRQVMPLVAAEDVETAGFFRRAWNGLLSFF